jgi:hypothetical protein
MGPAISALGPSITLCSDGTYHTTTTYELASDASKPWRTRNGRACCEPEERGTYELDRDSAGAITRVRFTPGWSKQARLPGPHDSPITTGDVLRGFRALRYPRACP